MLGNRNFDDEPRSVAETDEPDVSETDLFAALADPLRRRVLRRLDAKDGPVELEDIAEQIATDRDVELVTIQLHHYHLPKLADLGLVAYDLETNTVTEAAPPRLDSYLELFEE